MVSNFLYLNYTPIESNFYFKRVFGMWHFRIEIPSHIETVLIVCLHLVPLHLALVTILLTGPSTSARPTLSTTTGLFS